MEAFLTTLWAGLSAFAVNYGFKILGTLLMIIIGPAIIKWIVKIITRGKKFSSLDANTKTLIVDIVKVVLYVLLVVLIAINLGTNATAIAAVITSCGLAIGLALQGSLSNFAGGIMILVFKPFRIGDMIEANGQLGIVQDIGIFYTVIHTPDNKVVTMPNGALSNAVVVDYSVNPIRRVDFKLRVDYDSDIEVVKEALFDLAEAHDLVIHDDPDHAPFVTVGEQTESALVFYFRVWTKTDDYWTAYFDIMGLTKQVFDARGITIPRPQLDVHMKEENK
ncbi:MAG: mechanosensitive ion channel [Clostridia bacterium]|nr:mechanosensitive ion channel [Clostridia bacterium]